MPLYDYSCDKCQKQFELTLSLSELESASPKKICPTCGHKNITKMVSFRGGIITGSSRPNLPSCGGGGCPGSGGPCSGGMCPMGD